MVCLPPLSVEVDSEPLTSLELLNKAYLDMLHEVFGTEYEIKSPEHPNENHR